MTGREISLNGDVTRVVALTAADCEILYAVGAGDAVVGRGEYCDYPEAALSLPAVQSGAATNIEQIVALSPQVVFMDTMAQSVEQIAALEAAGIQVVVSEATDLEGVYESISVIGRVMNRETEAADVITGMKQTFQFGDVTGWAGISEEQVIQRNPGYIVTTDKYVGTGPTPEQEIAGRPGWEHLSAVKDGHILNLADDSLVRPGPRLADGVKQLYDFLYAGK